MASSEWQLSSFPSLVWGNRRRVLWSMDCLKPPTFKLTSSLSCPGRWKISPNTMVDTGGGELAGKGDGVHAGPGRNIRRHLALSHAASRAKLIFKLPFPGWWATLKAKQETGRKKKEYAIPFLIRRESTQNRFLVFVFLKKWVYISIVWKKTAI